MAETMMDELSTEIIGVDWRWSRTQYRDDLWIEPTIRTYRLKPEQKNKLNVQISFKTMTASYQVTNNLLNITFEKDLLKRKFCNDQAMDNTYLNDLARVVNYFIEGDRLVLELGNNAGYMYFSNQP